MINTAQCYTKLIWIPIGVNIAFIAFIPILPGTKAELNNGWRPCITFASECIIFTIADESLIKITRMGEIDTHLQLSSHACTFLSLPY